MMFREPFCELISSETFGAVMGRKHAGIRHHGHRSVERGQWDGSVEVVVQLGRRPRPVSVSECRYDLRPSLREAHIVLGKPGLDVLLHLGSCHRGCAHIMDDYDSQLAENRSHDSPDLRDHKTGQHDG